MANAKGGRQLIKADYRRIAATSFQAANVLLTESRYLGELLLGEALFLPHTPHVSTDEFAHIHALRSAFTCPRFINYIM